ncbi:MAG TPA: hypothetical protein VEF34_01295 [Syntrophobacteraceae bacterium]|nr:hypothetical protein [Syntrophobacteraceae bacterium]
MLPDMFKPFEENLRRKIREGEAPFLGLFADDFSDQVRNFLKRRLGQYSSSVDAFINGITQFPAIFASYLIIYVMEGFGDAGHFEVYSHIEKAIGTEIRQNQKERLWQRFRTSCHFLGLPVSPRTSGTFYMVDEYLLQAGFPLQYIPELVRRMIRLGRDVGLPDDDDPDSITLWKQSLLERLRTQFSIVGREAIERDDKGYYVRIFMRVLKDPAASSGVVEQRIREAIESAETPGTTAKRLSIPQILFKDMQIGILLPGGRENAWEIDVDGQLSSFRPQEGDRFLPLDSSLPRQVEVRGSGSTLRRTLWEDERNNRLIIFYHPSGRLCKRTSLAEKEVALDPGRYTIILRFKPDGFDGNVESLSDEPSLYVIELQLLPGQSRLLRKGPADLLLQADNVPTLDWLGDTLRGLRGTEVYPSNGLKLEIVIPQEMLGIGGTEYDVALRPGSLGDDEDIHIRPDAAGRVYFDLESYGNQWKPGVSRVLAELRRRGSRRALARSSIVLWNGLSHLGRSVFHCYRLPRNLAENLCENVLVRSQEKQITYRDDIHRFFSLVFEDGVRHHSFTWAVPGVFLSVVEHGENSMERTIKTGSTLAVNSSSRAVLTIYCNLPAILELGKLKIRTDFSKVGSKRLPLSSLLEYVGSESSTLTLRYEGSEVPIPLVELVSPHTVISYAEVPHLEGHDVQMKLQIPIQAIRVTAENIINGEKSVAEFQLKDIGQYSSQEMSAGGRLSVFSDDRSNYALKFALDGLQSGFWMLDFQARITGRWGALADRNGNIYTGHVLISMLGQRGTYLDVLHGQIEELGIPEMEALLFRVHRRLLLRYAFECSNLINLLFKTWHRLFSKLRDLSSVDYFFSLLAERPPEMVASYWIPDLNVGAIFPELFCYPKEQYAAVSKKRDSVLIDCLGYLPKLCDLIGTFESGAMDLAIMGAFANAAEINRGRAPEGFDLTRYRTTLKMTDLPEKWSALNDDDWRPGLGDYLGPMHYRYAICRTKGNYTQTLDENADRRGNALRLTKRLIAFTLNRFASAVPNLGASGAIDLGLFDTHTERCRIIPEHEEMQNEDLQGIVRFLSLFAQICRCEPRHPGTLERFFRKVKEKMDLSDPANKEKDLRGILSYLLNIGEDLFAFYLLLWELVFSAELGVSTRGGKCLRIIP